MFKDFPSIHPLVVHFPIVLILLAVPLQVMSLWKPYWPHVRWIVFTVIAGAFISALAASTLFHAMIAPNAPKIALAVFEEHEKYAQLTLWMSGITLLLKSIGVFFKINKRLFEGIVLIAAVIAAIFLSIAGHHGARLTHIEGIGPKGNYLMKEHGGNHDENIIEGMDMGDSTMKMKDTMPGMKNMPGMDTMSNMKDMDMNNMPGMKDMKKMNMGKMKGMDMKNTKDMKNMKDMDMNNMTVMDTMSNMKEMDMKNMPGMDTMKNIKGMDMKNMNDSDMKDMKDMPGMNMKPNPMDTLRFPDNNPSRKNKKPLKQ